MQKFKKIIVFYYLFRERLNVWLTSKGKTPGSFRHASCFHMNSSELNSGLAKSNIENKDEVTYNLYNK